jgi:alpha-tubulin suppressor-like RCC1 family protein
MCWGIQDFGALGIGTGFGNVSSAAASVMTGVSTAIAVAAGSNSTCVLLSDNSAVCTGLGSFGDLGNNSLLQFDTVQTVSGVSTATAIFAGTHTFATLSSGSTTGTQAWGWNGTGQMGLGGSTIIQLAPTAVP